MRYFFLMLIFVIHLFSLPIRLCQSHRQFPLFLNSDDGTSNGKTQPSFVNMVVELLDEKTVMNVELSVYEKGSKLNGVLGN